VRRQRDWPRQEEPEEDGASEVCTGVPLSLEMENPRGRMYFNCSQEENVTFTIITVPTIIGDLVQCREYEPSLHQFFVDLSSYFERDKSVDDYSMISLKAHALQESPSCTLARVCHRKKHCVWAGKVMEMNTILYHVMTLSEDGKSVVGVTSC
jgi:hypothetical protein